MITNIYEFYLEDGDKDQPKTQLQEVTQVDSYIDVELDPPKIELSDVHNEVNSTPVISSAVNESVDISKITTESKKLGENAADLVISLIKPAVNSAMDSVSEEIESSLNRSDNTIAIVTEGHNVDDPIEDIVSQYEANVEGIIVEAVEELIKSDPKRQAEVSNMISVITDNDIAKESFELKLKENIYRQLEIDLSSFDKYKNIDEHVKGELSKIWTSIVDTSIDTVNHINESLIGSVSKVIDSVLIDSWMDPVKGLANATNQALNVTNEVVEELTNQLNGIVNNFKENEDKVIKAFTTDLVGAGQNWIRNNILNPVDKSFSEFNTSLDNITNELISKLPWEGSLTGNPEVKYFRNVDPDSFMGNNWKYLRNSNSIKDLIKDTPYYRFATTFDWLIKIVPNTSGLPNLNTLLGLNKNDFLPILNYTLIEAGLDSVTYQVLTNTIVVPQGYRRPSKLSITLPDMYIDKPTNKMMVGNLDGKTYLRYFKEMFIDYVKSSTDNPRYSLVSRDYRECCYQITVYRFPYVFTTQGKLDNFSFHKTYLGIPEISISESGNESKQLITDVLTFNIVGEID